MGGQILSISVACVSYKKAYTSPGRRAVFLGNRTTRSSSIISAVDHYAMYAVFNVSPFKV